MRQLQALTVMMSGANVFLTGAPGAGKTYVLHEFIRRAQRAGKQVAVTASTGIAASHLNGTTIHSWSGLGILDRLSPYDLQNLSTSDRLIKRYNSTDVLVIDEVSMLHSYRLDMINQLAKVLRGSEAAFGGMQVILVGDLFQLPPVNRGVEGFDFAHRSEAWRELDLKICYLTEQHRQQTTDGLLELLEAMRQGSINDTHKRLLVERHNLEIDPELALTRLYSHNVDVETINQHHLNALETESRYFERRTKGHKTKVEQLSKGLLAPETLELRPGAEVMFVANNFAEGFVNGSRGRVVGFEGGMPVVELMSGKTIYVEPHTWSLIEDGVSRAEVSQLPLRLAWAITIHKSQGMSLDAAQVDLSRAFTPGMGYVALSRVRSLAGLYLQGINATALKMHPEIYDLDSELRFASAELATHTEDIAPEAPAETSTVPSEQKLQYDQDLFEALKRWRYERAVADKVAPFIVAHNTTLESIAARRPTKKQELMAVAGLGTSKIDRYGDDILKVVKSFAKKPSKA